MAVVQVEEEQVASQDRTFMAGFERENKKKLYSTRGRRVETGFIYIYIGEMKFGGATWRLTNDK